MVWYIVEPGSVQPGGWTECIVRLREPPRDNVRLTLDVGGKSIDVVAPAKAPNVPIERVSFSLAAAADACAPHPLIAVIWCTAGTNHRWGRRFPTAEEERLMAFYALGCGVKRIGYSADVEQGEDGEGLRAVSDNKPLWDEIGRINELSRKSGPSYLSAGCSPLPKPKKD